MTNIKTEAVSEDIESAKNNLSALREDIDEIDRSLIALIE